MMMGVGYDGCRASRAMDLMIIRFILYKDIIFIISVSRGRYFEIILLLCDNSAYRHARLASRGHSDASLIGRFTSHCRRSLVAAS